jgi:hypothetical protein
VLLALLAAALLLVPAKGAVRKPVVPLVPLLALEAAVPTVALALPDQEVPATAAVLVLLAVQWAVLPHQLLEVRPSQPGLQAVQRQQAGHPEEQGSHPLLR